jgi:hypothetical protein
LKINVYGINYEFNNGNKWTAKASVIVNGHTLLDKAEFRMPHKITSFAEAESVIRKLLTEGEAN